MSTNIEVKDIPKKLQALFEANQKYLPITYFVFIILLGAFFVFKINSFSNITPTDDQVSEKLQTIQRPHIDQASIDKIQQLQDQNVEVESLFKDARDNPFSE